MAVIYGLFDPREPLWLWEVRYIGQTIETPARRLTKHVWTAKREGETYSMRWIRSLLRDDIRPHIQVLEQCAFNDRHAREITWIASGRRQGWRLTNATDGGESNAGFRHSEESRKRMSETRLGYQPTDDHIRNAAEATRLARENDPTILDRVSASLKKFYAEHPEEVEAIGQRNRQWWTDHPEARAERGRKEVAYNLEHPEMIVRRNDAIRSGHLARDQTPLDCPECDAGPFKGPTGLTSHIQQKHNVLARELTYCECGAGPFVGQKGLGAHTHMVHDIVDLLTCGCGDGPFRGEHGLRIHQARFCKLNKPQ